MGGLVEKVLPRCSSVPEPSARFHDLQRWSDSHGYHVVQGERELVQDCRSLGRFQLQGIPPGPAARLESGALSTGRKWLIAVSATELTSGTDGN